MLTFRSTSTLFFGLFTPLSLSSLNLFSLFYSRSARRLHRQRGPARRRPPHRHPGARALPGPCCPPLTLPVAGSARQDAEETEAEAETATTATRKEEVSSSASRPSSSSSPAPRLLHLLLLPPPPPQRRSSSSSSAPPTPREPPEPPPGPSEPGPRAAGSTRSWCSPPSTPPTEGTPP